MSKKSREYKDPDFKKDSAQKDDSRSKSSKFGRSGGRSSRNDKFDKASKSKGRNDISWYTPDPQLVLDAGRWPYSRPVGTPLSRNSILHIADTVDSGVPGICSIGLVNTIGPCSGGNDSPNVAANAVYTFVRHANSGSRNYDANDLMLYVMAMDSIYSFISWTTRIYATVGMYASMNKYLPTALAWSQGKVNLDSIRSNMANFRAQINSLILKVGSLIVPDSMPIFMRHSWLYQNYFIEGDNIKDQIYTYYPLNVYKFQLDSNGAGMLKNVSISDYTINGELTADSFINILNDLITPIFNDEDFNIMSGDLLKAYEGNILRLVLLPDLLIAQPVNNFEVLQQIKNSTILSVDFTTASTNFDIIQDSNKEYLINNQVDWALFNHVGVGRMKESVKSTYPDIFRVAYDEFTRPRLLTSESLDVSPAENMINTRLTPYPEMELDGSSAQLGISNVAYGTEIPAQCWYYAYDKNWNYVVKELPYITTYDANDIDAIQKISDAQSLIASYRFHPAHIWIGVDTTASPTRYVPSALPNLGIDNFTTIDHDHLDALHKVAILGEFNVPRLAVVK